MLPDDSIARSGSDAIGVPVEIAQPVVLTKAEDAPTELAHTGARLDLLFALAVGLCLLGALLEVFCIRRTNRDKTLEAAGEA